MKVLLALDDSDCSEAALAALIEQFAPYGTQVRVVHVLDWPRHLPTPLAFAEGPAAAECVLQAKADAGLIVDLVPPAIPRRR